jgi:hypothetical protein
MGQIDAMNPGQDLVVLTAGGNDLCLVSLPCSFSSIHALKELQETDGSASQASLQHAL